MGEELSKARGKYGFLSLKKLGEIPWGGIPILIGRTYGLPDQNRDAIQG